jgi:hypothetical protein
MYGKIQSGLSERVSENFPDVFNILGITGFLVFGILKNVKEHSVSETGSVSVLR